MRQGGGGGFQQRANVPESLLPTVRSAPGVAAADGNVSGYAQFVDKQGKAIGDPGRGAPTFGGNWGSVPQLNPYHLVTGGPPTQADQVVMDKSSADKAGYVLNDKVKVLTQSGSNEFTLVGIAKFGDSDNTLGATSAFFTTEEAQKLVGKPGEYNAIGVVAADGVSQQQLADDIRPVLPAGDEVLTGAAYTKEVQDQLATGLSFFNTFLLIFALISLFVGSFIIYNTFSIIVAQRSKELAMLRAVGRRPPAGGAIGAAGGVARRHRRVAGRTGCRHRVLDRAQGPAQGVRSRHPGHRHGHHADGDDRRLRDRAARDVGLGLLPGPAGGQDPAHRRPARRGRRPQLDVDDAHRQRRRRPRPRCGRPARRTVRRHPEPGGAGRVWVPW